MAYSFGSKTQSARPKAARTEGTAPGTLLLSAVDDTLLDDRHSRAEVAASWAAIAEQVEVVLVSARTVDELIYLLSELGTDADMIAENGACTAVRTPRLARALGATDTLVRHGRRWYVANRGAPADEVVAAMLRARTEHAAPVRLTAELPFRRRKELLGPDRHRIHLAQTRRCSALAEPPHNDAATRAWLETLRGQGFRATVSDRWVSVWRGPDKGEAARAYLAARRTIGALPPLVAAIGHAASDVPLLEVAAKRFVVQRPSGGHDRSLLAVPGAVALPGSGHDGWRQAATSLMQTPVPVAEAR